MANLKTVFLFEFRELIKKKALIISTLIIALIFLGITSLPRILALFDSDKDVLVGQSSYSVAFKDGELEEFFTGKLPGFNIVSENLDELREAVDSGKLEILYYLTSRTSFTVIQKDMGSFDDNYEFINLLLAINKNQALIDMGIDPQAVLEAEDLEIEVEYEILGRDGQGFFVGYVFLFGMYLLILSYGQLVASSVAREKDSRAMELLITSTRPRTLIIGKVLAAGLVGVIQVLVISLFILLGFSLNKSLYPPELVSMINTSMSLDVLIVYIVFSLLGYLLYLFIYAALGSLVSKMEDLSASITSVTILFVIAYLIASTGMTAPDTSIVRVSSFIPFVALFTTPIRYMLTSVKLIEITASLLIMSASTFGIAALSIYIYRQGSLNYGKKISLLRTIKALFKRKQGAGGS